MSYWIKKVFKVVNVDIALRIFVQSVNRIHVKRIQFAIILIKTYTEINFSIRAMSKGSLQARMTDTIIFCGRNPLFCGAK